jgi:hypothetical protein
VLHVSAIAGRPSWGGHNEEQVRRAHAAGESFVELMPCGPWMPVCATVWPRPLIESILAYDDEPYPGPVATAVQRAQRITWRADRLDDYRVIGGWCTARDVMPLATVPCLVEHPDDQPSTHTRRGFLMPGALATGCRRAVIFADTQPASIDPAAA